MLSIEETFEAAFKAGEDFYLLPRDATGEVVAKSESRLRSAIRAGFLAVLDEAADVEQYTCNVACDHGEECRTTRRAALRAKIKALGKESSEEVRYDRLAGKRLPVMEKENVPATKAEDDGSHWKRLGVKGGMYW